MPASNHAKTGMGSRVCVAAIAGAHGVRGLVKVKSFTEEASDVASYGPLSDEAGNRRFEIVVEGSSKGLLIARIAGISDRNAAEALRGLRLFVERAALPDLEEETYYHTDLIGLPVKDAEGVSLGVVRAIYDFGAGDFLEVLCHDGTERLLPFTRDVVPDIDLTAGCLTIILPGESEEDEAEIEGSGSGVARSSP